jgi:ABC-type antimicrobial peptide transport system permease subunit
MVLREGIVLQGVGLAAGLGIAVAGTRVVRGPLFGVSPTDPLALIGSAAVLFACGLTAAALPARRASRVDPSVALRAQ